MRRVFTTFVFFPVPFRSLPNLALSRHVDPLRACFAIPPPLGQVFRSPPFVYLSWRSIRVLATGPSPSPRLPTRLGYRDPPALIVCAPWSPFFLTTSTQAYDVRVELVPPRLGKGGVAW